MLLFSMNVAGLLGLHMRRRNCRWADCSSLLMPTHQSKRLWSKDRAAYKYINLYENTSIYTDTHMVKCDNMQLWHVLLSGYIQTASRFAERLTVWSKGSVHSSGCLWCCMFWCVVVAVVEFELVCPFSRFWRIKAVEYGMECGLEMLWMPFVSFLVLSKGMDPLRKDHCCATSVFFIFFLSHLSLSLFK